jgi:outer membrane lipoprotein-sorting protein
MLRGGYLRVETDGFEQVATPETTWILVAAQKQYMKQPTKDKRLLLSAAPGFEAVLAPGSKLIAKGGAAASHLGKQSTTRVQFESPDSGMPGAATQYLHIDPKTNLPAGVSVEMNGQKFAMEYRNIRLDAALTPKRFAWAPPAGWKEMSSGAPQDGLLKIGSKAPDFAVLTPSGKKLSLAQVMKGKKATLVNFWFYG